MRERFLLENIPSALMPIETWQYFVLGGLLVVFVAIARRHDKGASAVDDAFFARLEATVTTTLAARQFVLTRKGYLPASFGHRFWYFSCTSRTIRVMWDGRDREIAVELRDEESTTPVRQRTLITGPEWGGSPERYQRALDEVLEAVDAALRVEA